MMKTWLIKKIVTIDKEFPITSQEIPMSEKKLMNGRWG